MWKIQLHGLCEDLVVPDEHYHFCFKGTPLSACAIFIKMYFILFVYGTLCSGIVYYLFCTELRVPHVL